MKSKFTILLAGACALFLVGCGSGESSGEVEAVRLAPVEVLEAKLESRYPVEERFVGVVEARRRSLLAFEIAGTVEEVRFEEGETVEEGEVLARIDTARLEAREKELRAVLEQAEATRELTDKVLARFRGLVDGGGVSVQDLEEAVERATNSRALVARTEAQLRNVEVDLEKSELRAPFAGTVANRRIDEGAVAAPNQVAFEFLESDHLEIRVAMAADALEGVVEGAEVTVSLDSGKEATTEVVATVLRVLPQRDRRTRTVDVILSAPEGANLRDGDLVVAQRVEWIASEGFFLPRDALTESTRGLWACYVALPEQSAGDDAHRLDRRDLEIIHEYADLVYVRGALVEDDLVLASGLQKVAPNQRVRILEKRMPTPEPQKLTHHSPRL
ncbi:MAG: efflux RND transporter periplasmic adaptor subunit [Verrucomicrobiota bacterium]